MGTAPTRGESRPQHHAATVSLVTSGGLAAGVNLRRAPRVVIAAALPRPLAAELDRLVDDAAAAPPTAPRRPTGAGGAAQAPGQPAAGTGRASVPADVTSYTVTVQRADGSQDVMRASDVSMSEAFGTLVDWIEEHATTR